MKPKHKNGLALALLIALFAIPSAKLAQGNRELASKLEKQKESTLTQNHETQISQRKQRSPRKITLGQLFQNGGGISNAKDLSRNYFSSILTHHHFAAWKIQYDLSRMTLSDLRLLRSELKKTPSLLYLKERLEEMISQAEIALSPDDPGLFLDEVIKTSRFDSLFQTKLQNWALDDPAAAVAWFQSKKSLNDFHDGTIAGRKNRALVLSSLLRGLAIRDLNLAVKLFSEETRREEQIAGGKVLVPLAMKLAVDEANEGPLRSVLEKVESDQSPFGMAVGNPWFDYTKATGDIMRSAALLKSLENQEDIGQKMGAIILAQDDMTYSEKVRWLLKQLPNREERLQALSSPLRSELFNGPAERYNDTLETIVALPPGEDRDIQLFATAKALRSWRKIEDARRITAEISDPELRARLAYNKNDPFMSPEN